MTTVADPESQNMSQQTWDAAVPEILRLAAARATGRLWGPDVRACDALAWGLARAGLDDARCEIARRLGRLLDNSSTGGSGSGSSGSGDSGKAAGRWPGCADAADAVLEVLAGGEPSPDVAGYLVAWAYALPELATQLDADRWLRLVQGLIDFSREAAVASDPLVHKLLAGEVPAVLGWRLDGLPKSLKIPGLRAPRRRAARLLQSWITDNDALQTDGLHGGGTYATLATAMAVRAAAVSERIEQNRLRAKQLDGLWLLAGWALLLHRPDGNQVFTPLESTRRRSAFKADASLWPVVVRRVRDGKSIRIAAELTEKKPAGEALSMAATVDLPDVGVTNDDAKLAVLRPTWEHRRGRTAVDYHTHETRIEIGTGKALLVQGVWDAQISFDAAAVRPDGAWEQTCWHTDDDVHYLELEQKFTGGITLQRQIMTAREDGWTLLADSVLAATPGTLRYQASLPLGPGVTGQREAETREWVLGDSKKRAIVMPLALPEWQLQRGSGHLAVEEVEGRGSLALQATGVQRLYAPLFIDWDHRRLKAPRTWRQLTVAEDLEIVPSHTAAAYRIQIGPQQWVIYRSLRFGRRTFLGVNSIADFYAGRFDTEDGSTDELVTVEETE